jgi:pimeloyl-ACP methyl ester carboxylesterase
MSGRRPSTPFFQQEIAMTTALFSQLRRLAAHVARGLCSASGRIAIIIGIAAAIASSAHAAVAPFELRVTGAGPDVLLIPGLASSGAVWDDTVKQLCTHHRCHVFTLAGFAGVPAQPGPLLDRVDAALAEYVERQHLASPVVVGHSLGGFVALRLAIDHPADVGRLVIVDALPALGAVRMDGLTPQQLHDFAPQMRAQLMAQDPALFAAGQAQQIATLVTAPADVARVQAWGRQSDRAAVIDAMADMLGDDLRPRLGAIKAPTLVMGSWVAYKDQSSLDATRGIYERQYKSLAGVRIAMSPAGRHFIMLDDPMWFEKTLEDFIH